MKPLVLIPAAGFGTRVGQPEAKELLLGPQGFPLIDGALTQALKRQWPVHVITRAEKKALIQYLNQYSKEKNLEVTIQIIEPSKEWPDTLLQSKPFWRERNLLVLPDTIYQPEEIWDHLVQSKAPISVAVFKPADFSNWGVFHKLENGTLEICEKPVEVPVGTRAWGLLSFTPQEGEELLKKQLESTFDHKWKSLSAAVDFYDLESFEDVTRGSM